jgi:hypothetical protein
MSRPNFINGMKLRGICRGSKELHFKKREKKFVENDARVKKDQREKARYERANREYLQ